MNESFLTNQTNNALEQKAADKMEERAYSFFYCLFCNSLLLFRIFQL